jgi:hypothetical protein
MFLLAHPHLSLAPHHHLCRVVLYITPLSSSSTLVNSRESLISTVGGNDYKEAVPPRPDTPLPPGDFDFESEDKEEELSPAAVQFAEHINSEIRANRFLYSPFRKRFRWTRRIHWNIPISEYTDFYLTHFLTHEWTGEGTINIRPALHSERDLLHPHETREHEYEPSAQTSSSSSLAGPDDPNLVDSPSNSSYFTAVVVQPTLSSTEVNSGENMSESSALRPESPSQIEEQ